MNITFLTLALICMINPARLNAQEITGFWEFKKVDVGGKIMTPVAKWTIIDVDHTYRSGNGWLQNSVGTWTYDDKGRQFLPTGINGLKDEFGSFTVSFANENMMWEREEDGMKVQITMERIDEMPMSDADKLIGLWDLIQANKNGKIITSTFDPENKQYLFIRWDRIY